MFIRTTLIALYLVSALGCSGSAPVIDYRTDIKFDHYKRYSWLTETSDTDQGVTPLIGERVKAAITQALYQGGFVEDQQQPDMRARYYVQSITETKESSTRGGIGLGKSGGNIGAGVSLSFPIGGSKSQLKHQIMIDLIDSRNDKVIWRATDSIRIDQQKPEKIIKLIEQSINGMLSQFPPSQNQ